jgi:uncharacterized protein YuzE
MRVTHDPRFNIAYIRLQEKLAQVLTLKISDEVNIDVAPDGTIYGIELLNANEQLYREDEGKLLIINEATGERAEVPPDYGLVVGVMQRKKQRLQSCAG